LQLDCDEIETAMQLEDALTMLTRGCPDPSELAPAPEATPAEADPTTNTAIDASNDAQ